MPNLGASLIVYCVHRIFPTYFRKMDDILRKTQELNNDKSESVMKHSELSLQLSLLAVAVRISEFTINSH